MVVEGGAETTGIGRGAARARAWPTWASSSPGPGKGIRTKGISTVREIERTCLRLVMRRSLSMHGCARSADLHLSQRRGGAVARRTSGVATHDTQATPHHHPHLPVTTCPHQHIGSPQNLAEISSMGRTTQPQRIRAYQRFDPPQSHQYHPRSSQGSQDAHGLFGPNKSMPPMGL